MKRRDFLKTVGGGAAAALFSGCEADRKHAAQKAARERLLQAQHRPNILWLISEDTSPDFACYGNSLVKTPNLDRLASEGARYTNAFVTGPVSSTSRSAIITGMYQTSIGAHQHRSHRNDSHLLPHPIMPVTEYFRRGGYFRCNCAGLNYKQEGKTDWNFMYMSSALRRHRLVPAPAGPAVLRPDQLQPHPARLPAGQAQPDRPGQGDAAPLLSRSSARPSGLGRLPRIHPAPRYGNRRRPAMARRKKAWPRTPS